MNWRIFFRVWFVLLLLWFCPASHADPISLILSLVAATVSALGALGSAIATAVVGAVVSFGISAIAGAISKPKTPKSAAASFGAEAGQRLNISRNSVESHKVIYGRVRVSGPMIFVSTTNNGASKNQYLHMVIALAGHEVQEIEQVYIDENQVSIDGSGVVLTAPYRKNLISYAEINKFLGTSDQVASSRLSARVAQWGGNHRLRGIAYLYVRLRYNRDIYPNGVPQISAIVKGKKLFDPRTDTTVWSDNPALCIRDYLASTTYGLGASDAELDEATFIASANNCEELVTLADATTQKRYTCNGQVDTASKPIDVLKDLTTSMAGVVPYVQGKFRCFSGYYTAPPSPLMKAGWPGRLKFRPRSHAMNCLMPSKAFMWPRIRAGNPLIFR